MPIESKIPIEEINIKDLSVESQESGLEVDLEKDWPKLLEFYNSLNLQGPDNPIYFADKLLMLYPEKRNELNLDDNRWNKIWQEYDFGVLTISEDYLKILAALKIQYPFEVKKLATGSMTNFERSVVENSKSGFKILGRYEDAKEYLDDCVNYCVLFNWPPDEEITEGEYSNLKEKLLKSLKDNPVLSERAEVLAKLKIIAPKGNIPEWANEQDIKAFADSLPNLKGLNLYEYVDMLVNLRILTDPKVTISDKGLKFSKPFRLPSPGDKYNTQPNLPEIKKF